MQLHFELMKRLLILLLITLFCNCISYSQSTDYYKILDSLRSELIKTDSIKEVKLIHEKYKNGNTKSLELRVIYKSDTLNRNWVVGPAIGYYENGQIKGLTFINVRTRVRQDTTKMYYEDGRLKFIEIYPENYSDSVLYSNIFKSENKRYYFFMPNSQLFIYYLGSDKGSYKVTSYKRILKPKLIMKKHGTWKKYNHKKGKQIIKVYDMGTLISKTIEQQNKK